MSNKNIKVKNHLFFIILLIGFVVVGITYVKNCARNVVFMDFWRNIVQLIPVVMENDFTFDYAWNGVFGQRNPLQLLLIAFNIRFLNLNCIWEVYAGIIVISFSAVLLYRHWNRLYVEKEGKYIQIIKQLLFFPILLALFNLNQWEILSAQFSFVFMLRILFFLLVFCWFDQALICKNEVEKGFLKAGIFAGISICLLSQLYFPAMILSTFCTCIADLILNKGKRITRIKQYLIFYIPCIFSIVLYFWDLQTANAGGGLNTFLELLKDGSFFVGICYMLVASIIPGSQVAQMSSIFIILGGILLSVVIIFAVILFFKYRIFEKTFLPMLISAYGLLSIPIIIYGRAGSFDLSYLSSSRYTCETTLIWVGCAYIFGYVIILLDIKPIKLLATSFIILFCTFILNSNVIEYRTSIYRGIYKEELIQTLEDPNVLEMDEASLSGFQAPLETIQEGINLMQQYNLNVYSKKKCQCCECCEY